MAKVFIGIPTFNRPLLVRETLDSILKQTFTDYRVIVSDNQSAGDVGDVVERHVAGLANPRLTFCRQPENGGEYGQGRFFLEAAGDDEYFMILHDDDVVHPRYLENAVRALDAHAEAMFFVANFYLMDEAGVRLPAETARYQQSQGRTITREGLFDVLSMHVLHGFAPISATVLRKRALAMSGFVDADLGGNYPFEANVFLRLGEIGAKAWFDPQELVGIRLHGGSMRSTRWLENEALVRSSIRLWERRRFTGALERRRRALLSRFHRADAMIRVRQGDRAGARASIMQALRNNVRSLKAWGAAPVVLLSPGWLRAAMLSRSVEAVAFAGRDGGNGVDAMHRDGPTGH